MPFPSPGDVLDPGMESESLMSRALAGRFFTSSAIWETCNMKVRELAGLDQDVHDNICYGAWLIAEIFVL